MKILGIIVLVLAALALLPLGVRVRYDEDGPLVWAKLWLIRLRLFPKKDKQKKKPWEKKPKESEAPPEEQAKKKGGALDTVRAALPLVKPALQGIKKRLTIRELELHVTWAAADPADAAIGYGRAQAALGGLWALIDQNFRVKKSRLGCSVDFDQTAPTVYADATLTMRLGQVITLGIPLLVKFMSNVSRIKREKADKTRKEA